MGNYQIEKTPLWPDIKSIINSGKKPIKFEYRGMLHNVKEDIPILKITSIDIVKDYVTNISDLIQIEFKMALGDYMTRLYPYRNNLELTIKTIELKEVSSDRETNTTIGTERFKAVFLPDENPVANLSEAESFDSESANKLTIIDVKLQLLNRSLEPIRIKTVSGPFREVTQKKLIYNLLGGESSKVLVDGKPAIDGIDIVDPDNTDIRKHAIIPDGTVISSLPSFLQEKMGGVYNSGIGTYLQRYNNKQIWFVYPLFNYTRFDKDVPKVIFYAVPEYRFAALDRTYKEDGKTIRIVVTSNRQYKDSADVQFMNKGVGFRMADANAFMKKPVVMTEEGPKGLRTNLNHEVSITTREDGLNYAPVSSSKISSNPYKEYSKVALMNLGQIDLVWENSNHELIYPGMPCKYVFLSKDKTIELRGTILYMHTLITLQSKTLNEVVYKNVSHIGLSVEGYSNIPDVPSIKSSGVF